MMNNYVILWVDKGVGYNLGTVVLKPHWQDTKTYQNDTVLKRNNNKVTWKIEPEKEFE